MKTKIITELVQFRSLDSVTDEQIVTAINNLNEFQHAQDGFLNAELTKEVNDKSWSIIFHFENFEKLQAIGAKLRSNQVFSDFTALVVQESLSISFFNQIGIYQVA